MRHGRYFWILVWAALQSGIAGGTADADEHCLFGCPKGAPASDHVLKRTLYTASYNVQTKFSDWVAYVVTKPTLSDNSNRDFKADPDLADADELEPSDYKGAFRPNKYEMGHQAPLNSLGDGDDWKELNYLSNITPQKEAVNSGVWRSLEGWEEKLITKKHFAEVFVVTGTLYLRTMPDLPNADEPHIVPSGYWKVLAVKSGGNFLFGAVIIPQSHKSGTKSFCDYGAETTIDEIERATNLDLFPDMASADASAVEAAMGGDLLPILGCQ
jgi:endonuclease G